PAHHHHLYLPDALPISLGRMLEQAALTMQEEELRGLYQFRVCLRGQTQAHDQVVEHLVDQPTGQRFDGGALAWTQIGQLRLDSLDRKSTRLNSSHGSIR